MRVDLVALIALTIGCVNTREVAASLKTTEQGLAALDLAVAKRCAPADLGRAEAHLALARHISRAGDPRRVSDHATSASSALAQLQSHLAACQPPPSEAPSVAEACAIPEGYDGPFDKQGCPDGDRDGDGIPDSRDRCPDLPEDFDGWEDEDGCPEPDNDGDGILDVDDACPNEPGDPAFDGCPPPACEGPSLTAEILLDPALCADKAPPGLHLDGEQLVVDPPLKLNPSGQLMENQEGLRAILQLLAALPSATLEIQGHVSSDTEAALSTSQRRADTVADALRSLGAPRARIEAVGYGDQRPIDTNRTETGRARNNRIELYLR
ncbi:MAG: OmpA family protein [Deltaproteobacteria bacterium]|nr:MAG: OmpA family protein [Deltaproteobacteria bacterium]